VVLSVAQAYDPGTAVHAGRLSLTVCPCAVAVRVQRASEDGRPKALAQVLRTCYHLDSTVSFLVKVWTKPKDHLQDHSSPASGVCVCRPPSQNEPSTKYRRSKSGKTLISYETVNGASGFGEQLGNNCLSTKTRSNLSFH